LGKAKDNPKTNNESKRGEAKIKQESVCGNRTCLTGLKKMTKSLKN